MMGNSALKLEPNETNVIADQAMRSLVGYNIKRAYMALAPAAQQVLSRHSMRLQTLTCLSVIAENSGIAPSALAEYLRVERSNLVSTIDELEKLGLVVRERSQEDRRRFALYLTDAGREAYERAHSDTLASEAPFLAQLSEEDCRLLNALLARIEQAAGAGSSND